MKVLLPVDGSEAALAPIGHLESLRRTNIALEVLLLNVQPRFHRHVTKFTSRAGRNALRAERSAKAMAPAIGALAAAGIAFRTVGETGDAATRIATVAERERVDEVMMGIGRHPAWLRALTPSVARGVMERTDIPVSIFSRGHAGLLERYALPAGVAGAAALLLVAE